MKRLTALLLVVLMLICAQAYADNGDPVYFSPTISDNMSDEMDYSAIDWILGEEQRAAITITLLLDVDNSGKYSGEILEDVSIFDSYVAYNIDAGTLAVFCAYKDDGVMAVIYCPGISYFIASENILSAGMSFSDAVELLCENTDYSLYYENTVSALYSVLSALIS